MEFFNVILTIFNVILTILGVLAGIFFLITDETAAGILYSIIIIQISLVIKLLAKIARNTVNNILIK